MAGFRAPDPGGLTKAALGKANCAVHGAECERQAGSSPIRLLPAGPFGSAILLAGGKSVRRSFCRQCLINSEIYAFIERLLLFLSVRRFTVLRRGWLLPSNRDGSLAGLDLAEQRQALGGAPVAAALYAHGRIANEI